MVCTAVFHLSPLLSGRTRRVFKFSGKKKQLKCPGQVSLDGGREALGAETEDCEQDLTGQPGLDRTARTGQGLGGKLCGVLGNFLMTSESGDRSGRARLH